MIMLLEAQTNLIEIKKGYKMFTTQINKMDMDMDMDMDMRHDRHDDRRITIAFCFGEVKS